MSDHRTQPGPPGPDTPDEPTAEHPGTPAVTNGAVRTAGSEPPSEVTRATGAGSEAVPATVPGAALRAGPGAAPPTGQQPRPHPPSRLTSAVAASVLDQAAASLTNILVLVIAARVSTAAGFAAFSMVYLTFTVLLGLNMSYIGQAVVLERGEERTLAAACRSAVAFTACASCAAALLLATGGLLAGGRLGGAFAALGLVLPLVLVQDGLRYAFSALRRPGRALAADTLRVLCVVPALLLQPQHASPARLVAVWGLSALPALLLGLGLLRRFVAGAAVRLRGYLNRGHLGTRFAVEFAVGNASSQLAVLGLGLFGDPLAVGALRGATTLFGPLNVLFNSVNAFGPPVLGRLGGWRATVRAAAVLGGVLAAVGAGWALVLYALPAGAGRHVLGATWQTAATLLPAAGSQYAVMGLGTCALVTLRVLSPRATLSVQVVFSLLAVVLMLVGYRLDGAAGAAWGLAAGSALKAAAAWLRVLRPRARGAHRPGRRQRSARARS